MIAMLTAEVLCSWAGSERRTTSAFDHKMPKTSFSVGKPRIYTKLKNKQREMFNHGAPHIQTDRVEHSNRLEVTVRARASSAKMVREMHDFVLSL